MLNAVQPGCSFALKEAVSVGPCVPLAASRSGPSVPQIFEDSSTNLLADSTRKNLQVAQDPVREEGGEGGDRPSGRLVSDSLINVGKEVVVGFN